MSTSVTPSDSVSSTGKKKHRPSKSARLNAKPGGSQTPPTAPSSMSGAAMFAAGVQGAPVPQPGKYPVVFPSGAGEPTRDAFIAYDHELIGSVVSDLPGRFQANSRFAEFAAHSEFSSDDFETRISRGFYLGLAQQTVHAHVNMGLPMGDFSAVSSSDVVNFSSVRSILSQFGEMSSEPLGTRFLLADYESTIKALVRSAVFAGTDTPDRIGKTGWLPTSVSDRRSKFIVAHKLAKFLLPLGIRLDVQRLAEDVFTRTSDVWSGIKPLLGDPPSPASPGRPAPPDPRDRFDFLFARTNDEQGFFGLVGNPARRGVLLEIGLQWPTPALGDLRFNLNVKSIFSEFSDQLARARATFDKFFSMGSGLSNRAVATGSSSQLSAVVTHSGVTVVRTLLAQSAPEFSLLACFPSSVLADTQEYRVVLTTSLNVSQRATEFTQLDWKA